MFELRSQRHLSQQKRSLILVRYLPPVPLEKQVSLEILDNSAYLFTFGYFMLKDQRHRFFLYNQYYLHAPKHTLSPQRTIAHKEFVGCCVWGCVQAVLNVQWRKSCVYQVEHFAKHSSRE